MTAQVLFDTARLRDRLTSSGMPESQARAVTEGFDDALREATATRADLEKLGVRLDGRIDAVEQQLNAKMDAVEQRLNAKIDGVEQRLEGRISKLEESIGRRISEAQSSQSRWIVASMFGGLGLLFAALKLFP